MKKFFAILAVVALASCGEAKKEEDKTPQPDANAQETSVPTTKIDTTLKMDGKDSLYTIKGGKSDGTDSVWAAN